MRNYANHCMEQWIIWRYDANGGYAKTSAIANMGKPKSSHNGQSLPNGVTPPNKEVELANTVFTIMGSDSDLLKQVTAHRQGGESIEETCKKLGASSRKYYSLASDFLLIMKAVIYCKSEQMRA